MEDGWGAGSGSLRVYARYVYAGDAVRTQMAL